MPPWLSLSAIKDIIILIAVIGLVWWVYHAGGNGVKAKDFKALQTQIAQMQSQQQEWQREQSAANAVKQSDLTAIDNGSVVRPITVKLCDRPAFQAMLPSTTTATAGSDAQAGRGNVPAQRDIGPAVQEYERWVERKFADCRAVIAGWPQP